MNILGVSAYYHDSAACLVRDGEIVAAAQEERFTRKKHDAAFPSLATQYCLEHAGLSVADLDLVAFYEKPLLKFDRILETHLSVWPAGFKMFTLAMPVWLKEKFFMARNIYSALNGGYQRRLVFLEHHESHAASAFFPSPFKDAAILTLDGVGEWATGSISVGHGNNIELLQEQRFPSSLGLFYSALTYFTGFKVNSGEYKLMGLAPYGEPIYAQLMLDELLDLKADGSFRLNMAYFAYCTDDVMTSRKMERLFGGPARAPEAPITKREMDIAASVQAVTEEVVLRIARHAAKITQLKNLAIAGGVGLNCVANGRLLRESPFEHIWIQPAAGDAGGAVGAATFVWYQLLGNEREGSRSDRQNGSLLGPAYSAREVRQYLDSINAVYQEIETEDEVANVVAELIATGKVVGHCAGRMEFGPRALGSRSILGDARSPKMQSLMNLKIKFRESFRPFAPAVLRERVHEYFEMRPGEDSPYMLLVAPVRAEHRVPSTAQANSASAGLDRVKEVRSTVPAVTHVDYSARVQTVDASRHPRFYRILKAFEARTGCPMVINTSFNVRSEPIVNSPADAYRCFMGTEMDCLVIENCLLYREEQPPAAQIDRSAYLSSFDLD